VTIYLVRWPGLTASLVRAENEEDLLDILDQAGNPDGCECSIYDGPFAIDFCLPAEWDIRDDRPGKPVAPDQIVVGDLGPLAQRHALGAMEIELGVDEEGILMADRVLEKAFPHVHAVVEWLFTDEGLEQEPEGHLPEPRLRQALHAELARMSNVSWRQANLQRKTDPVSTVAAELDMPVALVRQLAAGLHDGDDDDRRAGEAADTNQTSEDRATLNGDAAGKYVGYFVNEHGEQATYSYDSRTGEAAIGLGDAGRGASYPVVNGEAAHLELTEAERMWLRACWQASGASQQKP
jgi:hypothetical protein